MNARIGRRSFAMAAALSVFVAAPALALPPMPKPSHDYKLAPAGHYVLDPKHTAVVIRVPHVGFSYSVFRFLTVSADLDWDPANPAADALKATVDPKSIATAPVDNFGAELTGPGFLDAGKNPTATFVSKAFKPIDATHGQVSGDLTIMGVTTPVTFDVDLVGDGQGFRGPVIGVTARTKLDPKAYALPPFIAGDIELTIDAEFDQQAK